MSGTETAAAGISAASGYAHPEVLVETEWVAEHLNDPTIRLIEADEDVLLYEVGHLPGAVRLDWHVDVQDKLNGDFVNYPQEGAQRAGHIPGAKNIPWATAANSDGTFKSSEELRQIYGSKDITPDKEVVAYCRIGERSAHTWFVLTRLLGFPRVRNYDGSWTEWGNIVRAPIEKP